MPVFWALFNVLKAIADWKPGTTPSYGLTVAVVESAREALTRESTSARAAHAGYHLVGRGRRGLEADLGYRPPLTKWLRRQVFAHTTIIYLTPITAIAALLLLPPVAQRRTLLHTLLKQLAGFAQSICQIRNSGINGGVIWNIR